MLSRIKSKLTALCNRVLPEINFLIGKIEDNKIGVLEFKRGWENQEIVYGAMQGIVLWYVVLGVMYG